MEEEQEKEQLINSIVETKTESQRDKENLVVEKGLNLVTFVNNAVKKSETKDNLRNALITKLQKRILSDENSLETELNNVEMIKLLEIIEKSDNDFISVIMSGAKDFLGKKTSKEEDDELDVTVEDMNKFKKIAGYLKKLDTSEGK